MRLPLALTTASTRFDRLAIVRSIISVNKFFIDFKTNPENSINVPDVILLANAWLFIQAFLYQVKCILNWIQVWWLSRCFEKLRINVLHRFSRSFVCDGSLSMRNEAATVFLGSHRAKQKLKCCLAKFSKNGPFILWYRTLRTTPFRFNKLWPPSHAISFHQLILSILSLEQ